MIATAILCLALAYWFNEARRQYRAVQAIQAVGGRVFYDYQLDDSGKVIPNGRPVVFARFGGPFVIDLFHDAINVTLYGEGVSDANMDYVRQLDDLQKLALWADETNTAKKGSLDPIPDAGITDEGLAKLAGMKKLWHISFLSNHLTDDGLVYLKSLPSLRSIQLDPRWNGDVTADGIAELQADLPDCDWY